MSSLMPRLDKVTRLFWRSVGRPVDLVGDLRPEVRDFYENTARWRMEVRTQWTPALQPGGELVSRFFGRRVQQLALPAGSARCGARGSTPTAAATPAGSFPAQSGPACT